MVDLWRTVATSKGTIQVTSSYRVTARLIAGDGKILWQLCFITVCRILVLLLLTSLTLLQAFLWDLDAQSRWYNGPLAWSIKLLTKGHDRLKLRLAEVSVGQFRLYKSLSTIVWMIAFHTNAYDP
jgi:hypothetical protein